MLVRIRSLLSPAELRELRQITSAAAWVDGRITAGSQAEQTKNNLQIAEGTAEHAVAGRIVLDALDRNALFFSSALPRRVFPPLFNCYTGEANAFGDHVDCAFRTAPNGIGRIRTDLSATLFLSDPENYDGGELVIEDSFGMQRVKLPAGDLVLYPASSVHRVEPVTRGARVASFFWIESMVREDERRRVLFDLDMAIVELRSTGVENPQTVRLTGCYHNLLRMWAEA